MDNQEETFNEWLAQDFILDEVERTPDINEKLVKMYDYFKLISDYSDEVEEM